MQAPSCSNRRIKELFGLEGTFKDHLDKSLYHGQGYLIPGSLPEGPSNIALNSYKTINYVNLSYKIKLLLKPTSC